MGRDEATTQTTGITPAALVGWYWRQAFPGQMLTISSEALALKMGFADISDMNRALLREYHFREYGKEHHIPKRSSGLTCE
jgi:hypothetical protein